MLSGGTYFRIRRGRAAVVTFRPGRLVWWLVLGWLVAGIYPEVVGAGGPAKPLLIAFGAVLGLLGCLSALAGGAVLIAMGTPVGDLAWWVVPLLAGFVVGGVPWSLGRMRTARVLCLLAPAPPLLALVTEGHVWPTGLVMYVLLIRPHLYFAMSSTAGLTRYTRSYIWLGAAAWILGGQLLALGPTGAWFTRTWPPGAGGLLAGTVATAAVMVAVHGVFLLVGRGSLSKVADTGGPAGLRFSRDRFAGLYGATLGIPWFCVMASGVYHYDLSALIGSALAFGLCRLPWITARIDVPVRHTTDRLDAAHFLFSVGRRRAELTEAWLDDFGRTIEVMGRYRMAAAGQRPGRRGERRRAALEKAGQAREESAFQLVEVMFSEARKTAVGDVDDTRWLPFVPARGRPPLLDVALKWADGSLLLLKLVRGQNPWIEHAYEPLKAAYVAYLCHAHEIRALANLLHGRPEEAVLDQMVAVDLYRNEGAINSAVVLLTLIETTYLGVDPRQGGRTPLARAAAELTESLGDPRLHPALLRSTLANLAALRAVRGDRESAEDLLLRAARIAPPSLGTSAEGPEIVVVEPDSIRVCYNRFYLQLSFTDPDFGPLLRGEAAPGDYLPAPGHAPNLWLLQQISTGLLKVPGTRNLRRSSRITRVDLFGNKRIFFSDSRAVLRWMERTEQRGGHAMVAQFHEAFGLELREEEPVAAAAHLVNALAYRQSEHFGIVDDDLRTAVRGAADALAGTVIEHLAALARDPAGAGTERPPSIVAADVVQSVKSRALTELLGETVPSFGDHPLMVEERQARAEYTEAKTRGDHRELRLARERLEHAWTELLELGGPEAEYATLRAGLPLTCDRIPSLLARLGRPATPGPYGETPGQSL